MEIPGDVERKKRHMVTDRLDGKAAPGWSRKSDTVSPLLQADTEFKSLHLQTAP
jgi:hypothetical protein